MKKLNKYLLLTLITAMMFSCGKKISPSEQAEYDALLGQRDSIENVRVALSMALFMLENTHMAEDENNWIQAEELVNQFMKSDSTNAAQMKAFQVKYPGLSKYVNNRSVEFNAIHIK